MTTLSENQLEWVGGITFKLERDDDIGNLQEYDICQLIGKQSKDDVKNKLYFDTAQYKPPPGDKKELARCDSYKNLAQELRQAAFKSGSTIFVNSTGVARKDARTTWKFTCSACRKSKEGNRFKRCTTAKPLPGQKTCKFTFTVAVDDKGFFLIQTAGNPVHNGHHRIDADDAGAMPNRLLLQSPKGNVTTILQPDPSASSDSIKEQVKREIFETLTSIEVLETAEKDTSLEAKAMTDEFCASLATFREKVKAKLVEANARKRNAEEDLEMESEKRACV